MLLKLGSQGPQVRAVQRKLSAQGFDVSVSGVYDEDTAEAVETFQASHVGKNGKPLDVDRKVKIGGDATWWALHHPSGPAQRGEPWHELRDLVDGLAPLSSEERERKRVLEVALGELERNVREEPDGSNDGPRVRLYTEGWKVPWCALFVSWCLRQARDGQPAFPPHRARASVQKVLRWAHEHSTAASGMRIFDEPSSPVDFGSMVDVGKARDPEPGDCFVLARAGEDGVDFGRGHIGFVVALCDDDNSILTIEGNCGNAVRSRRRPRSSVACYIKVVA